MPIIRMPDGRKVRFPDNMPSDEIKSFIAQKYPETQTTQIKPLTDEQKAKSTADYSGVGLAGLKGFGQGVASGLGRVASGATFGATDWIDRKTGGNLAKLDQDLRESAKAEGLGGALTVANLASEIGGNAIGAGGKVATKIAEKGIKGAKALGLNNTIQGAAYGTTSSDNLNDLAGNVIGNAVLSNALGFGIAGLGKGGQWLYNIAKPYANASKGAIGQAVENIGLGKLKDFANKAQQSGRSVLEVGDDDLIALAQEARQQSPKAYKNFDKATEAFNDTQNARNTSVVNDAFGSRGKYDNIDEVTKLAREQAQPFYDNLQNVGDLSKINPAIEQNIALNPFLRREVSGVLADPLYQAEYGVNKMPLTDWRVLDQVNRSINDKISAAVRAGEADKVRLLEKQKYQLLNMVDDVVPEYKVARGIYEAEHNALKAQKIGEDTLFDSNTSADKLSRTMKDMSDYEKRSLQIGAREKLMNVIEGRENQTLGLKKLNNEQTQSKLKLILGNKADDFINYAKDEVKAMRNVNKLTKGSQTSEKQNIRDKLGLLSRISKNPWGAIGEIGDTLNSRINNAQGDVLSQFLTERGGNTLRNALDNYQNQLTRAEALRRLLPGISSTTASNILKIN